MRARSRQRVAACTISYHASTLIASKPAGVSAARVESQQRERMTTETRTNQPAVVEGVPVEMVPTTAREHITGFAALTIPHPGRLGGDWHEAWFDVRPTRVSPHHITDERRFKRLLDQLRQAGLRDARPGLALLDHPARDWPEKVWAATHERAVVEAAWGRLQRIVGSGMDAGLPPIDRHDFCRMLPHPDQWIRVQWWAWRLRAVLTPAELAIWNQWQKEWRP